MKWERVSIWMVTKAIRLDEIRRGLWPESKHTWSLRGQRKRISQETEKDQPVKREEMKREGCYQTKWRQCLQLEVLIHMLTHCWDVRRQEDWELTLGFGKVEVVAILKRGFSWHHGDESPVEWNSRENGKREDLKNRCLVRKGFYCTGTEENGWRGFAFFFNMRESEVFFNVIWNDLLKCEMWMMQEWDD